MDGQLRASDDDRQRVVADLQRHTEMGRLSLDEFSDRVGAVYTARTLGDLATVVHDLPAVPDPTTVTAASSTGPEQGRQDLLVIFGVAILALVLLGVFIAVSR